MEGNNGFPRSGKRMAKAIAQIKEIVYNEITGTYSVEIPREFSEALSFEDWRRLAVYVNDYGEIVARLYNDEADINGHYFVEDLDFYSFADVRRKKP